MSEKRFISFYTIPFWVENSIEEKERNTEKLKDKISEVVINEENEDFIIKIEYDGLISIHIKSLENLIQEYKEDFSKDIIHYNSYMQYINAFYLLLTIVSGKEKTIETIIDGERTLVTKAASGGHSEMKSLTRHDTFRTDSNSEAIAKAEYSYSLLLFDTKTNDHPSLEYNTLKSRSTISQNDLHETIVLFKSIFNNQILIKHLALYTKSTGEYKHGDFDTSIVLAWTISENILNLIYDNRDNKSLKSEFNNIASIQEFLNTQNLISTELFNLSNKVRKFRNKIAHSNSAYISSSQDSKDALECTCKLIKLQYNFELRVLSSRSNIILSN